MPVHDGDSGVLAHVAGNVRRLRQERGLSQATLAERSGVSRRTIINLEAGEANVSLSGLDRVADALSTRFSALVAEPSAPSTAINALAWRGAGPESSASLLGSAPALSEAQLWSWSLSPGDRYHAEPDPAGWHELLLVTSGRLRLELEDGETLLGPGDHAIYSSAQRYAYVAVGEEAVRFVRVAVS
ncbi:helix-turn-helix domain-containing protein [Leifsonia sp. F6_8S_P_1B]|uniref:Helix-turn-helix domain-containing protein n=1 Tax=Leifsonia williamsii TaxID=3035919 RepID=A0ABT8K939_9MICO|nr:helix-turn-helix domain-containing protein [Leifsonia williamsii]MDN4613960.1 helix-turn-helix domain-containing protein [Leifsonia williamsii]